MTDFEREPGAIDNPSGPGGQNVDPRNLPPGDTADDISASGEPQVPELDLPGPDDPVAWNYVEKGTPVIGPGGQQVGKVGDMVGTDEGIFHGIAVEPDHGDGLRLVPSSQVGVLTPSRVEISLDADALEQLDRYRAPG